MKGNALVVDYYGTTLMASPTWKAMHSGWAALVACSSKTLSDEL